MCWNTEKAHFLSLRQDDSFSIQENSLFVKLELSQDQFGASDHLSPFLSAFGDSKAPSV